MNSHHSGEGHAHQNHNINTTNGNSTTSSLSTAVVPFAPRQVALHPSSHRNRDRHHPGQAHYHHTTSSSAHTQLPRRRHHHGRSDPDDGEETADSIGGGVGSSSCEALVPYSASQVCPFCQRPFGVVYSSYSAPNDESDESSSSDTLTTSSTTSTSQRDDEEPTGTRTPHPPSSRRRHPSKRDRAARRNRSQSGVVGNALTPSYFRSLPPIQDENDPASFRSTPIPSSGHIERSPYSGADNGGGYEWTASPPRRNVTRQPHGNEEELQHSNDDEVDVPPDEDASPEAAEEKLMREGYYSKHFVEVHRIGGGTFGAVYLCRHVMENITLGVFAVKKIPIGDDADYFCRVLREVRIMEEIKKHPNVLEYNHSWIDYARTADFGPIVRCLFVLMEYASEGSLDNYLSVHGFNLPNVAVWYFFLSAVAGMAHLHAKQIIHRDLKPQNLLLTKVDGRAPRLLVADFGTAALLSELSLADRCGGTGTQEYMAPELFETAAPITPTGTTGQPPAAEQPPPLRYLHQASKASDVWSLGMILHYLACCGTLPPVLSDGSVMLSGVGLHSPYERPPEMIELMRAMLHRDPSKRPSCSDIISASAVQTIMRNLEHVDFSRSDVRPSRAGGDGRTPRSAAPLLLGYRQPSTNNLSSGGRRVQRVNSIAMTPVTSTIDPNGVTPTRVDGVVVGGTAVATQTDIHAADWDSFLEWQNHRRRLRTSPQQGGKQE